MALAASKESEKRALLDRGIALYNAGEFRAALDCFVRGARRGGGPEFGRFAEHARRSMSGLEPCATRRETPASELAALRDACWSLHLRVQRALDAGRPASADELRRRLLKLSARIPGGGTPERVAVESLRYTALMESGRYADAFRMAESILDAGLVLRQLRFLGEPWDPEHAQRRTGARAAALERMAARGLGGPWPEFYAAQLREDGERTARMVAFLRRARYSWMLYYAAKSCIVGDPSAALSFLRRSLRARPVEWRARGFIAELLMSRGRVVEGLAEIDRAFGEVDRGDPDELSQVWAWRGQLKLWSGDYRGAIADGDEACRLGGLGADFAFGWRGAAKLKLGRLDEAEADLREALRRRPRDHEASAWLAELYWRRARPRQAWRQLRGARRGVWRRVLGALILEDLGDEAGAEREFAALDRRVVDGARLARGEGRGSRARRRRHLLTACLDLARGYRREEYGQAVWLVRLRRGPRALTPA